MALCGNYITLYYRIHSSSDVIAWLADDEDDDGVTNKNEQCHLFPEP